MPETPQILIACFLILLAIWAVASGVENMGRIAKLTFPILTTFVLITVAVSMKDMNFSNIKPVMSTNISTLISSSFSIFALPFGELVIFMTLFPWVKSKSSPTKIYLKSVGIATAIFIIANLRNLLILGATSSGMFYFASYQAVSVISIGEFFNRVEVLIGASVLLAGFIKVCVFLFASSIGLAKVCNVKDYKTMIVPCGLIILTLATFIFSNTEEMMTWGTTHQFYVIPFEVLLPIILLVTDFIKARMKKSAIPLKPENIGNLE